MTINKLRVISSLLSFFNCISYSFLFCWTQFRFRWLPVWSAVGTIGMPRRGNLLRMRDAAVSTRVVHRDAPSVSAGCRTQPDALTAFCGIITGTRKGLRDRERRDVARSYTILASLRALKVFMFFLSGETILHVDWLDIRSKVIFSGWYFFEDIFLRKYNK